MPGLGGAGFVAAAWLSGRPDAARAVTGDRARAGRAVRAPVHLFISRWCRQPSRHHRRSARRLAVAGRRHRAAGGGSFRARGRAARRQRDRAQPPAHRDRSELGWAARCRWCLSATVLVGALRCRGSASISTPTMPTRQIAQFFSDSFPVEAHRVSPPAGGGRRSRTRAALDFAFGALSRPSSVSSMLTPERTPGDSSTTVRRKGASRVARPNDTARRAAARDQGALLPDLAPGREPRVFERPVRQDGCRRCATAGR